MNSYDIINHNIETYKLAKETIPAISQYELGEISISSMRSLSLEWFAEFCDTMTKLKGLNSDFIIPNMTWRKLKPILIEKTKNERFKKYISNRSKTQFDNLLKDPEAYDKLLNGRWLRKPSVTRRGRNSPGRRSDEHVEGLRAASAEILNYVFQNNIEVFGTFKKDYINISSFYHQEHYKHLFRWYTTMRLSLDSIPTREIEVTSKLLQTFETLMLDMKVDARKLNLDYVVNSISQKLKNKMEVPDGTNLRCLSDIIEEASVGSKLLYKKGNTYKVNGYYISQGSIMVYLRNEFGRHQYVKYNGFEDMSIHRDSLLDDLFG